MVSLADLSGAPRCPPMSEVRVSDGGARALRHRIYNISAEPRLRVLWTQTFERFSEAEPRSTSHPNVLCRRLSAQQWPFCKRHRPRLGSDGDLAVRTVSESEPSRMNQLMLVSMPCAFTDAGRNFRGALYDARRILNAQHRSATPMFARGPLQRYEVAAVALTPYGHLTDSHFYASTAPWVLQLLEILPRSVPILVALSSRLRELYDHIGVPLQRLHSLPPGGVAYADQLLSLVTTPFGALEPLGAQALRRLSARLAPRPPPLPTERVRVEVLSRQHQAPRRSLRNEEQLLRAIERLLHPPYRLGVYRGSQHDQPRLVDVAERATSLSGC